MPTPIAERLPAELPDLRRRAVRLVHREGLMIAPDDLVQDTVVIALQNVDRFDGANLGGWLSAILTMRARDLGRRLRSRRRFECEVIAIGEDTDGEAILPDAAIDASQPIEIECRQVLAVLAGLPEEASAIIMRALLDGRSNEAIATELGIAVGTVRSRLSRALAELRARCDGTSTYKRIGRAA